MAGSQTDREGERRVVLQASTNRAAADAGRQQQRRGCDGTGTNHDQRRIDRLAVAELDAGDPASVRGDPPHRPAGHDRHAGRRRSAVHRNEVGVDGRPSAVAVDTEPCLDHAKSVLVHRGPADRVTGVGGRPPEGGRDRTRPQRPAGVPVGHRRQPWIHVVRAPTRTVVGLLPPPVVTAVAGRQQQRIDHRAPAEPVPLAVPMASSSRPVAHLQAVPLPLRRFGGGDDVETGRRARSRLAGAGFDEQHIAAALTQPGRHHTTSRSPTDHHRIPTGGGHRTAPEQGHPATGRTEAGRAAATAMLSSGPAGSGAGSCQTPTWGSRR